VINFTEVIEREAYGFIVNRPVELSRVLLFAEPFRLEVNLKKAQFDFPIFLKTNNDMNISGMGMYGHDHNHFAIGSPFSSSVQCVL